MDIFTERAIQLAKKGIGFTSPNPAVGAVIVRNGKIIGEGYHRRAGSPHAEVEAIRSVKNKNLLRGAKLYVTLEPCCHYGKTPPCTEAIVSAGISGVVIGMRDPYPQVNGAGLKLLREQGIKVSILPTRSKLYQEIRNLNQPFLKLVETGFPYVVLKVAVTLDGKIATKYNESKWITSEAARKDARLERSLCDAVIVGAGTVAADDPELAPHRMYKNKKLLRVIIDCNLSSDLGKRIFRDEQVFAACTEEASSARQKAFEKADVSYAFFGKTRVSISALLQYLGKRNCQSVYVEGGAGVHGAFYDAALKNLKLIDKVIFYIAPKIIGGEQSRTAFGGMGVKKLVDVLSLKNVDVKKVGEDVKISGIINIY